MSGVTPESTTANLASQVPKETDPAIKKVEEAIPGTFPTPESTTANLAAQVPKESSSRPQEEKEHIPGSYPQTPGDENQLFRVGSAAKANDSATKGSTSASNQEAKESETPVFGVNPIPASSTGVGNPITLRPGDKVPHPSEITPNTIESTVRTDREAYEADASEPISGNFKSSAAQELPKIHDSNLPGGSKSTDTGVAISSAAPVATTAGLAAAVPLESQKSKNTGNSQNNGTVDKDVPEKVKDSLKEAHANPEAAGQHGSGDTGTAAISSAAPVATTAGLAAAVPLESQKSKNTENLQKTSTVDSHVPGKVKDSFKEAHANPEAAGQHEAVEDKKDIEHELLKKVSPNESAGTPGPVTAAPFLETAPGATGTTTSKPTQSKSESPQTATTKSSTGPTETTGVAGGHIPEVSSAKKDVESHRPTGQSQSDETKNKDTTTTTPPAVAAATAAATAVPGSEVGNATDKSKEPVTESSKDASNGSNPETKEKKKKHHRGSSFLAKIKEAFK